MCYTLDANIDYAETLSDVAGYRTLPVTGSYRTIPRRSFLILREFHKLNPKGGEAPAVVGISGSLVKNEVGICFVFINRFLFSNSHNILHIHIALSLPARLHQT